jgi:prepilin-type N-terminal cleavage/methylation domain-containing protein
MMKILQKIKAQSRGFLLIELLVAIALFSIIVVIAVGGFVNALKTQRQVTSLFTAESNLDIAMEQMTREIRTGSSFCGGQDETCSCTPFSGTEEVCSDLKFTDAEGEDVDYALQNGVLEESVNGAAPENITGGNVAVKYFNFILFGNDPGDHWNPRITMVLGITPGDAALSGNTLNLQTTVSARQIDCSPGSPSSC